MFVNLINPSARILNCFKCRVTAIPIRNISEGLDQTYNDAEREKILQVINDPDVNNLSSYEVSKTNLKKYTLWRSTNGQLKTLSDIENVEGFTKKTATKLFKSILNGTSKEKSNIKIKGQILNPTLLTSDIKNCKTVLAVYVTVNSVSWTLISKENYEVQEWKYHGIDYPDSKRLLISDIFNIAWKITNQLPTADIYVMKAEATTLRAAGSDPNNPKVLAVNLQKAQMVAMMVALLNTRNQENNNEDGVLKQKLYFLRPTLPYRLYGTLVGNERVSTDQAVDMILQDLTTKSSNNSHAYVPDHLQSMFRSQKDLQKDMLGHCLLLSLTFMDLCIYKNQERIVKLAKRGDR